MNSRSNVSHFCVFQWVGIFYTVLYPSHPQLPQPQPSWVSTTCSPLICLWSEEKVLALGKRDNNGTSRRVKDKHRTALPRNLWTTPRWFLQTFSSKERARKYLCNRGWNRSNSQTQKSKLACKRVEKVIVHVCGFLLLSLSPIFSERSREVLSVIS